MVPKNDIQRLLTSTDRCQSRVNSRLSNTLKPVSWPKLMSGSFHILLHDTFMTVITHFYQTTLKNLEIILISIIRAYNSLNSNNFIRLNFLTRVLLDGRGNYDIQNLLTVIKLSWALKWTVSFQGRKSGLVVSKLDSRSKGCGFKSRLFHNTRWKWSTFKAMPGPIPAPNSGSYVEKNIGSQMCQSDKKQCFFSWWMML